MSNNAEANSDIKTPVDLYRICINLIQAAQANFIPQFYFQY